MHFKKCTYTHIIRYVYMYLTELVSYHVAYTPRLVLRKTTAYDTITPLIMTQTPTQLQLGHSLSSQPISQPPLIVEWETRLAHVTVTSRALARWCSYLHVTLWARCSYTCIFALVYLPITAMRIYICTQYKQAPSAWSYIVKHNCGVYWVVISLGHTFPLTSLLGKHRKGRY